MQFCLGLVLGQIVNVGSGFVIKDLMVRWNERTEIREEPEGSIEYVYDMYRFDLELPPEIEPGREAVEYYLEHAKDAIVAHAQSLSAQQEGFDAE